MISLRTNSMKILLIGNYLPDKQESMLRFAGMLQQGMTAIGNEVRLLQPPIIFGRISPSRFGLGKWLGYIDKFLFFPHILKQELAWADIIHICDHSNAMYLKYVKYVPCMVTCNDLLAVRSAFDEFPQNRVSWTGRYLQRWILYWLRQSAMIVCISNATRDDVLHWVSLSRENVKTIYLGLHYPYAPMPLEEATQRLDNLGCYSYFPYFLHVGGTQWYKNLPNLFQIFVHLYELYQNPNLSLIMVGKHWTTSVVRRYLPTPILSRVKVLYETSNEDLCALYSMAHGLIFPSWHEGFGWPVLEAMASGCPVFASNVAPMTEVGGDAAIYFDPSRPDLAAKIIFQNEGNLCLMRQQGLKQAAHFHQTDMIGSYFALYQQMLSSC